MKRILLLMSASLVISAATAATYYVSPTGNDNNAGTSVAPVKTILKGVSKATAAGDIVSLADGDYEIGSQIKITKAISIQGNVADCSKVVVNCKGTQHALYNDSVDGWSVSGVTFTNVNRAVYSKKAITVSHCAFRQTKDNATLGGAALCFPAGSESGLKLVEDCVFEDLFGAGTSSKGAVYLDATFPITFRRCVFCNCTAGNNGGAIGQNGNGGIVLTAENCEFRNCQGVAGGAVFLQSNSGKTATFRNCLFAGNTSNSGASDGGSAVYTKSAAMYENCTFADNNCPKSAGSNSAAVRNNGGASTLVNCVFWNNTKKADAQGVTESSVVSSSYTATNCAAPTAAALTGDTNIALSASPFAAEGAYTLAQKIGEADNPCIDGGVKLDWMTELATDLAGVARINGEKPDIGAYEYSAAVGFLMLID